MSPPSIPRKLVAALLLVPLGCGDETPVSAPPSDQPVAVHLVSGAVVAPALAPDVVLDAPDAITALGSLGGLTVTGTGTGLHAVDPSTDTLQGITNGGTDGPVDIGAVSLTKRRAESILILADNGWFHTSGATDEVLWSPASDVMGELNVTDVSAIGAGEDEQLWLATDSGLHLATGGELSKWSIEGQDTAPTAVLVTATTVFAGFGGTLFEVDPAEAEVVRVDHDFGDIRDIAPGPNGLVFVATDAGLYRRDDEATYTHFTLADDDAAVAIGRTSFDPLAGLYFTTESGLFVVGEEAPLGVAEMAGTATEHHVSVDDFGTVWVSDGPALSGFALGTPLSFASDIAPILVSACMSCHAEPGTNAAPPVAFDDYATTVSYIDAILTRVSAGQMPPPGQGSFSEQERELLVRWQTSGLAQ